MMALTDMMLGVPPAPDPDNCAKARDAPELFKSPYLNHFVLIEVGSVGILVACARIT